MTTKRSAFLASQPVIEPFDYGDCLPVARACVDLDVDLDVERACLQENGELTYGPGDETPRSSFQVSRKVADDVSYVFDTVPMPHAVYFTSMGAYAWHPGEAEIFFTELQVGDKINIY